MIIMKIMIVQKIFIVVSLSCRSVSFVVVHRENRTTAGCCRVYLNDNEKLIYNEMS